MDVADVFKITSNNRTEDVLIFAFCKILKVNQSFGRHLLIFLLGHRFVGFILDIAILFDLFDQPIDVSMYFLENFLSFGPRSLFVGGIFKECLILLTDFFD